jgi:signal transduction histidine kinase
MIAMATLAVLGWIAALGAVAASELRQRRRLALVAHASHELRGPLCAARLALFALAEGEAAARVAAIDLELRRAGMALDDLAAAPHGRRARDRLDVFDVGDLLREAVEGWRPLAEARGVDVVVEPPAGGALVRADRLRLAQACGNLVANAVEHGGGAVRVRATRNGSGCVRVEVSDGGPGLPAPVADLVTAARGRRARRGHGLAIAAGIAERHGGRLAAAPSAHGARLVLELPGAEP